MKSTDLNWLLQTFVEETPGVLHAQTVSADGMDLARSSSLNSVQGDQLAAIASGLASLTDSAAEVLDVLPVKRQVIEAEDGWILISRISSRASLTVVARPNADLGLVGFEMSRLADRAGDVLSPEVIARLKNSLSA